MEAKLESHTEIGGVKYISFPYCPHLHPTNLDAYLNNKLLNRLKSFNNLVLMRNFIKNLKRLLVKRNHLKCLLCGRTLSTPQHRRLVFNKTSRVYFSYCKGLIECPMILSPFMVIQHGHLWSIHIAAWSCLHTAHIHLWFCILLNSSPRLDFRSMYNHRKTTGTPSAKNTSIVRIGTLNTNKDIPKSTVPIPRVTSHLFVRLSIDKSEVPYSYFIYWTSPF